MSPRRAPTIAETRAAREYEERRLAGREWYGVQLDAPITVDATSATFADLILRDPATQERAVTREQVAAVMERVLTAKQKVILPLLLDGHSALAISRQTGIPWSTVKRSVHRMVKRVRVALGLETVPVPVRVNRLAPDERRRRKTLRTMRRQKANQIAGRCRCGQPRAEGYLECQPCRDRRTAQRRALRATGRCRDCREPTTSGRTFCEGCLEIRRVRDHEARGTPLNQRFAVTRGGGQNYALRFPADEWRALEAHCEAHKVTKANAVRAAVRRLVREGTRVAAVLLCTLVASAALAQDPPVTNPTTVEFDPSPDHSVMLDTNTPAVTTYALEIVAQGATQPTVTQDFGKPDPDSDGKIRWVFASSLLGWPVSTTVTYVAHVTAIGPYGSGRSTPSNTFAFNSQYKCSFAAVPSSWSPVPGGGVPLTVKISVSASGCAWAFDAIPDWLTITPSSGTATTAVTITAAPNTSGATRLATFTLGTVRPASFGVSQAAIPPGGVPPAPPANVVLLP